MRLMLLSVLLCCALVPLAAADWPHFLGPSFNAIAPESGINKSWNTRPLRQLWRVGMSDNGYSGPAVVGDRLYIIDHAGAQDIVRAINVNTGRDIWTYKYDDARGDNYGFARCTPTVDGGNVYTLSRQGNLLCLTADSGKLVWRKNINKDFGGRGPQWDHAASPFIDGNKLIVCPGGPNAAVVALDKRNGALLWKGGGSDRPGYATPVVATLNGTRQYIIFNAGGLLGVDAGNGKTLWSFAWKTQYDVNAATPVVLGNTIFITTGYGHGSALVEIKGNRAVQRWANRDILSTFTTPVVAGGFIYCTGDSGHLVCMDAKTGAVRWKQPGFEKGGVLGIDGTLIVFNGGNGDLIMCRMSPDRYQELGRFKPLGGQSWTAPIAANGKLFVRNKKTLACYALK